MRVHMNETPVLVYDGLCALCNRAVQFVLRHDSGDMRFAPLNGEFARGLLETDPALRSVDSILFVTRSTAAGTGYETRTKSDAVLAILAHIGWPRSMIAMMRMVPRPVRDFLYDVIAGSRYRVFGRKSSCPVPAVEVRHRFID